MKPLEVQEVAIQKMIAEWLKFMKNSKPVKRWKDIEIQEETQGYQPMK